MPTQNEDPEFEGIKTAMVGSPQKVSSQNEDPEFEGIKTHILRHDPQRYPSERGPRIRGD